MSLIGYVTLEEANEYIDTHYLSTDERRFSWEDLEDEDKAVLLTKSFQTIELLPFAGKKLSPGQQTAFPRAPRSVVPLAIKWAQIENALTLSDESLRTDIEHYDRLRQNGVIAYSLGNLSETLGQSFESDLSGVVSSMAVKLLRPFIGGGYRM